MPLPREEQEVHITYLPFEDKCIVSTTYPPEARRLMDLGFKPGVSRIVTSWKEVKEGKHTKKVPESWDEVCWNFDLPGEYYKGPRPKKQVSEEQRNAVSERMKAYHATKGGDNVPRG